MMTDDWTKEIRERLEKALNEEDFEIDNEEYIHDIADLLKEREVLREALETLVIETNPANTIRLNQYPEVAEILDSIFKGADDALAWKPEGVGE